MLQQLWGLLSLPSLPFAETLYAAASAAVAWLMRQALPPGVLALGSSNDDNDSSGNSARRQAAGAAAFPAAGRGGSSLLLHLPDAVWHMAMMPLLDRADLVALRATCSELRHVINQRQEWLKLNAALCDQYARRPELLSSYTTVRGLWLRDRPGRDFPDGCLLRFAACALPALGGAYAKDSLRVLRLGFQPRVPYSFVDALARSGVALQELQMPFLLHADNGTPAASAAGPSAAESAPAPESPEALHARAAALLAGGLPRLQSLALSNCVYLDERGVEALAGGALGALTHLGLSDCTAIGDSGLLRLRGLSTLRSLLLHTSSEVDGSGWQVLEDLPLLTSLSFSSGGAADGPAWGRLTHGSALAAVSVLSSVGQHGWRALARLPALATLQVHDVRLREAPPPSLAPLQGPAFPELTKLVMYDLYRKICLESMEAMFAGTAAGVGGSSGGGALARLRTLEVWHNVDDGLLQVVGGRLTHLTRLDLLADNSVRADRADGPPSLDAQSLARLGALSGLRSLNVCLHATDVHADLAVVQALAGGCPELSQLTLGSCRQVEAATLGMLAGGLPGGGLGRLAVLRLSDCPHLDDELLMAWATSPMAARLRDLGLTRCPGISDAGLLALVPTLTDLASCELKVLPPAVTDSSVEALVRRARSLAALTVCACPGTTAQRCSRALKWEALTRGCSLYWSATLT